jgi:UPF0755 protein
MNTPMDDIRDHNPTSADLPAYSAPAPQRRWVGWVIACGILLLAVLAAGLACWQTLTRPAHLTEPQTVIIMPRTSFRRVATSLQQRKLIPSALTLRAYGRLTGKGAKLKIGEYEITNGMTPIAIVDLLISGRAKAYWVTVPEGKWVSEIGGFLAPRWPDAARSFAAAAGDLAHWKREMPFLEGDSLEGYLFPDTYLFNKTASARDMIDAMLKACQSKCWAAYQASPPADGRSFREVLILASLVEAEAKVPDERPVIAGVYCNRLRQGMKLECDATILYAKGERLRRVLYRDLEVNSPYNTYQRAGLPPGPIGNPGLSSFQAALHPSEVPYLYYVARGDGTHVFSRTFDEHQRAIREIRGK